MSTTTTLSPWLARAIRQRALGQAVDEGRLEDELATAGMSRDDFDRLVSEDRAGLDSIRNDLAQREHQATHRLGSVRDQVRVIQARLREADNISLESDNPRRVKLDAELEQLEQEEADLLQRLETIESERRRELSI